MFNKIRFSLFVFIVFISFSFQISGLIQAATQGKLNEKEQAIKNDSLRQAITEGNLEAVTACIQSGADVNVPGLCRNTPLIQACWRGYDKRISQGGRAQRDDCRRY